VQVQDQFVPKTIIAETTSKSIPNILGQTSVAPTTTSTGPSQTTAIRPSTTTATLPTATTTTVPGQTTTTTRPSTTTTLPTTTTTGPSISVAAPQEKSAKKPTLHKHVESEVKEHRKVAGARTILQVKNDTEYCQLDDRFCYQNEDDDQVLDLPNTLSFDFDSTGMTKTNILYPNKIKRHFGIIDTNEQTSEKTSQELVPIRSKKLTVDHNNKQLIRMAENSFFEKMIEKKHKYSMGSIYQFPSPIEEETDEDGKKTIHLFCPFIYPMIADPEGNDNDPFAGLDEDTRVKIHIPVQMLNKTTNGKIVRLAEISGENMSLSESYFELDSALQSGKGSDERN